MSDTEQDDERVDAQALARALDATSRKAINLAKGAPLGNPLHDPSLAALATRALGDALGPPRTGTEPFPLTIWQHGASHVGKSAPGIHCGGALDTFVALLHQRAHVVAAKKTGWVVEPTTNPSGLRTNEATLAMHAVFLDCDATGSWDKALAALAALGLAHVAYQSSGWKPEAPKWRVVLPLAAPFSVKNDLERAAWKKLYHRVRVLVGALGQLREEGFDPRTDPPAIPWFCTERRDASYPPREVVFHPGASLDLLALAMALPAIIEEPEKPKRVGTDSNSDSNGSNEPLDDERLDAIVDALSKVTQSIPRGRHDLYLALPGVLLDRGILPDDVLTICTEVSLAYPRKHPEHHADNIHGAKTTIAKWLAKDPTYTRIGTLQGAFPEVAAVLDNVVGDPVLEAIAEAVGASATRSPEIETTGHETPPRPPSSEPLAMQTRAKKAATSLRKKLEALAREKIDSKDARKASAGQMLLHVLDQGIDTIDAFECSQRERLTKAVFNLIGFDLPETSFDEIVAALSIAERGTNTISTETYRAGAAELAAGKRKREEWDAKEPEREAKRAAEKREYQRRNLHYLTTGEILP